MITAEGAKSDMEKLIAEAVEPSTKLILKGILVAIKVILTCRTNTVKIMDKLAIPRDEKKVEAPKEA